MAAAAGGKYDIGLTFRGLPVSLQQVPRDRAADGDDNTGWCVWEASNILLRYLSRDAVVRDLLRQGGTTGSGQAGGATGDGQQAADATADVAFHQLRLLDLSAGAGLVAAAVATAGATVVASDVPAQLPQLQANLARLHLQHRSRVCPYYWGDDVAALAPVQDGGSGAGGQGGAGGFAADVWYDLVVASDIVFIAIRDKRTAQLQATLRALAGRCACLLFVFEERLPDEEQAFMQQLGLGAADMQPLRVVEVLGDDVTVSYEDSLKGAGAYRVWPTAACTRTMQFSHVRARDTRMPLMRRCQFTAPGPLHPRLAHAARACPPCRRPPRHRPVESGPVLAAAAHPHVPLVRAAGGHRLTGPPPPAGEGHSTAATSHGHHDAAHAGDEAPQPSLRRMLGCACAVCRKRANRGVALQRCTLPVAGTTAGVGMSVAAAGRIAARRGVAMQRVRAYRTGWGPWLARRTRPPAWTAPWAAASAAAGSAPAAGPP
jgi:predicted nicotinamide N-methyase